MLALWLFLIGRALKGIKYNLPRRREDLLYPLLGFAVLLPLLGSLGFLVGFLTRRTRRTSRGPRSARAISPSFARLPCRRRSSSAA